MPFDWIKFLNQHNIEFINRGPNVARGNINVSCPYCLDDPSYHLGISLSGKGWGCWRNDKHRGKSPVRLVQALLGCSPQVARSLVHGEQEVPQGDLSSTVQSLLLDRELETNESKVLSLPLEFKLFNKITAMSRLYFSYMFSRGYSELDCRKLSRRYDIRFANRGPFGGRVIFPVYEEGKLQTWQGRAISSNASIRYQSHTMDDDVAKKWDLNPALKKISDCILWYDKLVSNAGDVLVLVEGPFDALRIEFLGFDLGIRGTCLFTRNLSHRQEELLYDIANRYRDRVVLLDEEAWSGAMSIQSRLISLGFRILFLPIGIKDPAELSGKQLLKLFT